MSLVAAPASTPSPGAARLIGYSLAGVGAAAAVGAGLLGPGPAMAILALVAVLAPPVLFALMVTVPEAFVVNVGGKAPVVNLVLIAPVAGLFLSAHDVYLAHPEITLLCGLGAVAIGLIGGVWAPRRGPIPNPVLFFVVLTLLAFGYGWAAPNLVNRAFDASPGRVVQVTIQSMHVTTGRGDRHHLGLAPWGPVTSSADVTVPPATYANLSVGGVVCATLHSGALGLAWYKVASC